ncbi:MAG: S1C family serine protease [Rhodospirillales bacterium]|nr:S1C family serine protease [Rhodospirillales bacterium]
MSEEFDWEIPLSAQPKPEQVSFDLDRALGAVVGLRATIPEDAFTAGILGTERTGNGILISANGLVLTIGYLIAEAESVWLTASDGSVLAGHALGYDFESGFGLVQALGRFNVAPLEIGSSAALEVGDYVIMAGDGGRRHSLNARVIAKREFAGYWEYVLDEAVFTAPPHPNWGGSGLIDRHGRLVGIGSLLVRHADGDGADTLDGNMIVPIDLLPPILDDMQTLGRTQRPPRPWLGAYVTEVEEALVVAGLAPEGPAEQAELQVGDQVLAVNRQPVSSLVELFRSIWAVGEAGVAVPLTVMRNGEPHEVRVLSATRDEFMKTPQLH